MQLDSVRIGDVEIYGVDAVVVPDGMPYVLLGNSFLSRFQMRRDNDQMVLERRLLTPANAGTSHPKAARPGPPTTALALRLRAAAFPVFRMLWFTWLAANTTMWMNDVAARG